MHIVGLLIDPAGRIDNAGKATIAEAVTNGFVNGSNAGLYETLFIAAKPSMLAISSRLNPFL
jgi:hypothetical protein